MERRVILRFRDLVTEEGGSIKEHSDILRSHGEVWWGWWMRQYETPPRMFLGELREKIAQAGQVRGYLFNTGEGKLFSCTIADVKVAPPGTKIGPPDPERTPEYYSRGQYPAWFLLRSIADQRFEDCKFFYDSFPSRTELHERYSSFQNKPVKSLDDLRQIDVTIWVVGEASPGETVS
jgi:hypothetical protein